MSYIIVGLGNPGEEYENTRHNVGRIVVSRLYLRWNCDEWKESAKYRAHIASCTISGAKAMLVLPDTYMNRSGAALKALVASAKKAEHLIVVYDDIDLPLGTFKISFGRGSGGHKGVESIIRSVRTRNFIRIRIGISPALRGGGVRKPKGQRSVLAFLMDPFKRRELEVITHLSRDTAAAIRAIVTEGRARAMTEFN